MQYYHGDIRVAISGIIGLVFGEPWKEEAMKKLEEVKHGKGSK